MKLLKYLFLFQFVAYICSCSIPKDVVYFQGSQDLEKIQVKNITKTVFETGDLLSIYVSATDMEAALPFNLSKGVSTSENQDVEQGSSVPLYLINYDGTILFPVLGKLKVIGLSRVELVELLKEKLKTYINEPVVTVKLENFKITVLGEVSNPGTYSVANEKINILQAIGVAGDLTIKGKRKNITVIRELNNLRTYHKIDITSKDLFNSPIFYLKQNDIVYVEPNTSKVRSSKTNSNLFAVSISVISVLLTLINFSR